MPEFVTRLGSALVLAALALAATIYSPWTFLLLVIAVGVVAVWEWDRLTRGEKWDGTLLFAAAAVAAVTILVALGRPVVALEIFVVASAVLWLARTTAQQAGWTVAGLVYASLPMAGLIWLRSDPVFGVAAVLYVFVVAWTTDIASYAAGRLIGGAKLAPGVSPNKTWSGFIGGVLAAGLAGYAFALTLGGTAPVRLAFLSILLALACQAGDLVESAVKRHFGTKDMSNLIPGHGGVLDRVDGLLFAAVLAALVALLRDPVHPGQALLIW